MDGQMDRHILTWNCKSTKPKNYLPFYPVGKWQIQNLRPGVLSYIKSYYPNHLPQGPLSTNDGLPEFHRSSLTGSWVHTADSREDCAFQTFSHTEFLSSNNDPMKTFFHMFLQTFNIYWVSIMFQELPWVVKTQWERQNNVSTIMLAVSSEKVKKYGRLISDGKPFSSVSGDGS